MTYPGICSCDPGYQETPAGDGCYNATTTNVAKVYNTAKKPPNCQPSTPRPISPLLGAETHTVDTGFTLGGKPLQITFDNRKVFAAAAAGLTPKTFGNMPALGALWESSLHKNLKFEAGGFSAQLMRGDGTVVNFKYNPTTATYGAADVNDKLELIATGYRFTTAGGVIETYNRRGRLDSVADGSGNTLTYAYSANAMGTNAPSDGYLIAVSDNLGRTLSFTYTLPAGGAPRTDGLITKITDAAGRVISIDYDAVQNLQTITWPDGKSQRYTYENAQHPWAMTGLIDENASRFITWGYDAAGRAVSSQLAGGVESYSISYATPPSVTMTQFINPSTGITLQSHDATAPSGVVMSQPNGQSSNIGSSLIQGVNMATSLSQAAGSGCAASNSVTTYDANGNVISKDDFSGMRSCFAYDTKNQETTRVEGLANTVACTTVLPANATLPAHARKITTTYHPDWRMPTVITAPSTITSSIYHGQPDPFNGNTAANCTPALNLPNGKPQPLLCKQVTQATLPSGALDSTVANTVTRYTYNATGKVLTATDTLNRATTYTYYASTAFTGTDPNAVGNTVGDLMTITNPAGFVTTFNAYDKAGRILKMTDPKGIVTDMTYTPRGWVNTVTTTAPGQTARTTTYTYDGVGQLTGVTNPDGSTLAYTYDAAHRLIGATDAKGNSVTYTLDNMGNRIKEDIKDPTGVLQRSINRSFDALNRLQQVSGAVQ